jgi:hypothetical protein
MELSKRGRIASQLRLALGDEKPATRVTAEPPPQPAHRRARPRHLALVLALLLLGVLLGLPTPAWAQVESHPDWKAIRARQVGKWVWQCREWPVGCAWEYRRRWVRRYRPPVYSYVRRDRDEDDVPERANCLWHHPLVRATGDDKLTDNDAKISAQDRWSIEVETRYGTRYSGIDNAERLTTACVKKVPTSTIEKGQAGLGIRHFVCTVEAVPCPPDKIHEDVTKRRSEKISEDVGRRNDPRWDEEPPRKRWYQRYRRQ